MVARFVSVICSSLCDERRTTLRIDDVARRFFSSFLTLGLNVCGRDRPKADFIYNLNSSDVFRPSKLYRDNASIPTSKLRTIRKRNHGLNDKRFNTIVDLNVY